MKLALLLVVAALSALSATAQNVSLLAPVGAPGPRARAWNAAERARTPAITSSTFVSVGAARLLALPLRPASFPSAPEDQPAVPPNSYDTGVHGRPHAWRTGTPRATNERSDDRCGGEAR